MKPIITACTALALLASPALAQHHDSVMRDGERHLVPKDQNGLTDEANLIQNRAIEMGFFSWPMPTEKAASDQANRPRSVADCKGHDPAYRPAPYYSSESDWQVSSIGLAKTFIYEWMAYGNAIEAQDCTCATLTADWGEAVASFETLTQGIDNFRLYTSVPNRMRNAIKRDYDQMCDIRMLLDLG